MLLQDKTVVVSGVGAGLGKELVLAAVRDGANVVCGARSADVLAQVCEEADPDGKRVAYAATDITKAEACTALVALAEERFGGVDALINCAARDNVLGGIEQTTEADWRDTFEVNVFGLMNVIRATIPALKKSRGSIVLIGSQTVFKPQVVQIAYAASKGAQISAMYHLAQELGPAGVRINTVMPSWMWGPEVQGYVALMAQHQGKSEDEVKAGLDQQFPLQQMSTVADVAEAAIFLASDRARTITGQTLLTNAGEYMR